MNGKLDVMVDIETTGTCHDAGIIAIGAVVVQDTRRSFYEKINPKTLEAKGFILQRSTMEWWDKQRVDIREEAFSGTKEIGDVLVEFDVYLTNLNQDYNIWGNAASFDCSLLKDSYDKLGIPAPWLYWNEMCYRTVKNMFPWIKLQKSHVAHNALNDAIMQANHLAEIFGYMQVNGTIR